jgi:VWFA-related protein
MVIARALFGFPLALAALGAAPGQFRASVDGVRLEALVVDRGQSLAGLTARDFTVTDNGVPQSISVRPIDAADIDVVVALDTSASVRGARLEHLRAATDALVQRLAPRDRATLIAFNHRLAIGPADAAPDALRQRVAGLAAGGATSLVDAATTALVWASGRGRPSLAIVFSDGRDTASWTRFEQALSLARMSDAVVDAVVTGELAPTGTPRDGFAEPATIGPRGRRQPAFAPSSQGGGGRGAAERFLLDFTGLTGGQVLDGDAGRGLADVFALSLAQFRTRYELTYMPSSADPGWHAIDVKVTGRRGATVRARRGYQR